MISPADPGRRPAAARDPPSLRRTILAFALAPGVAAAACVGFFALRSVSDAAGAGLWNDLVAVVATASASGYGAAVVFGVPLYAALPVRWRGSLAAAVPLGSVSAAAPWLLVAALSPPDRPFTLGLAAYALAFGAVGGLAFWALRRGWRR